MMADELARQIFAKTPDVPVRIMKTSAKDAFIATIHSMSFAISRARCVTSWSRRAVV
jgi:hypothetical protein